MGEIELRPVFEATRRPVLIAGPSSAETEEQVMETALGLQGLGIALFRSGTGTPRTPGGSSNGGGAPALKWLQRVKERTGMRVTTGVADSRHVEEALRHGIDILWLGARTTASPSAVQEVADALRGSDVPILVENPISASPELWIGAIERLHRAGLRRIAAVHRGSDVPGERGFRYQPMWELASSLKHRFGGLQVICDHSRLCGRRDTLQMVARRALELGFDGLMTEVHRAPDEAWSDSAQQVAPAAYRLMLEQLGLLDEGCQGLPCFESLDDFRTRINEIDQRLMELLGTRMKLAEEIGKYKKRHNISILQESRWSEVVQRGMSAGEQTGLSRHFVGAFLAAIHDESISHQLQVMGKPLDGEQAASPVPRPAGV